MPSNLPKYDLTQAPGEGCLYVVALPIGNPDDITVRAIDTLKRVDVIAAEDTRKAGRVLNRYNIKNRLLSYHEHNEIRRSCELLAWLDAGQHVALVSDAGTPAISDPGYRLVRTAADAGIRVVPVPGVSAVVTALSASGLGTDSYIFLGFAPKKENARLTLLQSLRNEKRTLVFYESPKRIVEFLKTLQQVLGDRQAVLGREMTKTHEEFLRGSFSQIHATLAGRDAVKGECTLLVAGVADGPQTAWSAVERKLETALRDPSVKLNLLAKDFARKYGFPKRRIYETALKIKKLEKEHEDE